MKQAYGRIILALFTLSLSLNSHAALLFTANLDSLQEVPSVLSLATGFGTVLLSNDQSSVTVSLSFSGLIGTQTAAHIHGPGAPGVNAGIVLGLPLGQLTNANFTLTPSQILAFSTLTSELFYFNVHSTRFPGGEIRGQILNVPEPTTLILVALGFAGMGAIRKKAQLT